MNSFYFIPSALNTDFFGMLLDEAIKEASIPDNNVYFALCGNLLDSCLINPEGNQLTCQVCKHCSSSILKSNVTPGIKVIDLGIYQHDFLPLDFQYNDVQELKNIQYKGVKIGYAVLSSYIYLTRNQNVKIDFDSKLFFDQMLNQSRKLTDTVNELIDNLSIDKLVTYNGRFSESRPFFETAKERNIESLLYEGIWKNGDLFKVSFSNCLPHSVKANLWRIDACWNDFEYESDAINFAKTFFDKRRNGIPAGDRVYTLNQKKGKIPTDWDNSKENIVIFNSSEDEFVAIGDEYSALSLYPTQYDGIISIAERFKFDNSKIFYLRIHPNLAEVNYKYHLDLYSLPMRYSNFRIVGPKDSVNTYDLMDIADKIIVFGSTMGLEAAYAHKPVLLLSCSMYYYADISYNPLTEKELFNLLDKKIEPKSNINILKLGLYYLRKDPLFIDREEQFKHIDYNSIKVQIFGKTFSVPKLKKRFGSFNFYYLELIVLRFLAKLLGKNKFIIPDAEETEI